MTKRILAAVAFAFTAALALVGAESNAGSVATRPVAIATVASVDYRVVLTAREGSAGAAPTARVTVASYKRTASGWRPVRVERLAGTYFWHTITGPHALCRLELRTSRRPSVVVQLLQSPALGCAHREVVRLDARA